MICLIEKKQMMTSLIFFNLKKILYSWVMRMPNNILNEDKWKKAKEIVHEEYNLSEEDEDDFWALVMGVYKKMKGKFKKKRLQKKK